MHTSESCAVFVVLVAAARGEALEFRGPLTIPNVPPGVVTVQAGDVDGDGKKDLIASNASNTVTVCFQSQQDRRLWKPVGVSVGAASIFTCAGDFDGDGAADLAVADGASTTQLVRSRGDRSFDAPVPLREARAPRWIVTGDWDQDGHLDLACCSTTTNTLTIFAGDGALGFRLVQSVVTENQHSLAALDFDGDGILDLALGTGRPGILLLNGEGNGSFKQAASVNNLGCAKVITAGELNGEGLGDLAAGCRNEQTIHVGLSLGDGRVERVLSDPFGSGEESAAIADLNGDGLGDLSLVSVSRGVLRVHPSNGDGSFGPFEEFGPTGTAPVSLIAADLDRDGHNDLVAASSGSSTLTVAFGQAGAQFLDSASLVTGYGVARAHAIADFNRDGLPDFFSASLCANRVDVYLKPGLTSTGQPSFFIATKAQLGSLAVADLDGDGALDIAGASALTDSVYVTLLDAAGGVRAEQAMPAGGDPLDIHVERINADALEDLLVASSGSDELSIFFGQGGGAFAERLTVPTIENPRHAAIADADGDGRADLVVQSPKAIAIHYQTAAGGFEAAAVVPDGETRSYADIEAVDLDGGGAPWLIAAELRSRVALLYRRRAPREYDAPFSLNVGLLPNSLFASDFDGDGLVDLSAASNSAQAVGVTFNLGAAGWTEPVTYTVGFPPAFHRILDLTADGISDLVALGVSSSTIRFGAHEEAPPQPRFRRGDADGNGRVGLQDALTTLSFLFIGGVELTCHDAADFNDSGELELNDAIQILIWTFLGGDEWIKPPGPRDCGEDPSEDLLPSCERGC